MGKISSSLAIVISSTLTIIDSNIINKTIAWPTSEDIICTPSDLTCTVNCNIFIACGVNNGEYEEGPEIHCPTISSCTECNINCFGRQSCSASIIYGHECTTLNIDVEEKDNKKLTIYAPNGGSLNIIITTLPTGADAKLTTSYIYAGIATKDIYISCSAGKEFKGNTVNASAITGNLTFVSENDCKTDGSTFICPTITPCSINCSGSACKSVIMYAALGTRTLDFICGVAAGCDSTVLNCDFNVIGDTDCSAITGCDGPCVLPPTYAPTVVPTYYPSYYPSIYPSSPPSINPTYTPTNIPSVMPSFHPSMQPTIMPTDIPTMDTIYPTNNPSNDPSTANPTNDPTTAYPSISPTSNPTLYPSTFQPTYYPTVEPTYNPSLQPTYNPSIYPSVVPSVYPSNNPTFQPTYDPSSYPSLSPIYTPTSQPSSHPTSMPNTFSPTLSPTTDNPSVSPTTNPSVFPTYKPSQSPTAIPTRNPTEIPSSLPSSTPTSTPTNTPSNPTTNPTPKPTQPPNTFSSLNSNAEDDSLIYVMIVGICIGVILCMVLLIYFGYRRYHKRDEKDMDDNYDDRFVVASMTAYKGTATNQPMTNSNVYGNNTGDGRTDYEPDIIIDGRKVSGSQKQYILNQQLQQYTPEMGMVAYKLQQHMGNLRSGSIADSDGKPIGTANSNMDSDDIPPPPPPLHMVYDNIHTNSHIPQMMNPSIKQHQLIFSEGIEEETFPQVLISGINMVDVGSTEQQQNSSSSGSGIDDHSDDTSSNEDDNEEEKEDRVMDIHVEDEHTDDDHSGSSSGDEEHSTSDNYVVYNAHADSGSSESNEEIDSETGSSSHLKQHNAIDDEVVAVNDDGRGGDEHGNEEDEYEYESTTDDESEYGDNNEQAPPISYAE